MISRKPKRRFCANNPNVVQVAHTTGIQLTTLGIPCIYYGTEQAFDGNQGRHDVTVEPLDQNGEVPFSDRYVREAMFGGAFGAFQTSAPLNVFVTGIAMRASAACARATQENELPQFRVSLLLEACKKNAQCKAETRRILARVEALRKSEHVNALAWKICDRTASRTSEAAAFERCLETAAAEPACRIGLRLPRDRQTLEQCAATLSSSTP